MYFLLLNVFLAIAILLLISDVQVPSYVMSDPKLIHLLYYLPIKLFADCIASFSLASFSADSHEFGLLEINLHVILLSFHKEKTVIE